MAIGRIPEPGTGIPESIVDAKGDIVTATAADTPARLAVGTTEHRLVAASGEATGLKYVADTTNYAVAAKGDLLVGTAADTLAALTVGANGTTLVADSAEATGLKWDTPASGGGLTLLSTTALTGTSVTLSSISQDYVHLYLRITDFYGTGADTRVTLSINNDSDEHSMGLFGVEGSAATATGHHNQSHVQLGRAANSSTLADKHFSATTIYNYTSTAPRNIVGDAVGVQGGSRWYQHCDGIYYGTSACTSLVIGNQGTTISGGTAYLYGVK
jgi:hypothetical protein